MIGSPETVKELNHRFKTEDADSLLQSIDLDTEEKITLLGLKHRDYIKGYLTNFIDFTRRAASQGCGFLVIIYS